MEVSQRGIDLIKKFEGFSSTPYLCPAKVSTIGYGHTQGVLLTDPPITIADGEDLLRNDLQSFEAEVLRLVRVSLSQSEFDALVSFVFNIGTYNFAKSTVLRRLNKGLRKEAGEAMLWWNKAGSVVLPGLIKRRQAEKDLYDSEINLTKSNS
jgi:lysozyme